MTRGSIWIWIYVVLSALTFLKDIQSLKLLEVTIPQFVLEGETTTLICEYDLQENRLYSVSWYKDHEEFYRYKPGNQPKQNSYKLEGARVDLQNSTNQQVVLCNVTVKASGTYRCEISAEAPSFSSVHGEEQMQVIALPKEGPEIAGKQKSYNVGDIISLNCTSGKSYPRSHLSWYVNDVPIESDYESVITHEQQDLLTSVIGLSFQVKSNHFMEGKMEIRCVSTILVDGKDSIREQKIVSLSDNKEALFLVQNGGGATRLYSSLWAIISLTLTSIST